MEIENKGFAMAREDNERAGTMTYSIPRSDYIIIDHTEIEPAFNGKGVWKPLFFKIVEMAEKKTLRY